MGKIALFRLRIGEWGTASAGRQARGAVLSGAWGDVLLLDVTRGGRRLTLADLTEASGLAAGRPSLMGSVRLTACRRLLIMRLVRLRDRQLATGAQEAAEDDTWLRLKEVGPTAKRKDFGPHGPGLGPRFGLAVGLLFWALSFKINSFFLFSSKIPTFLFLSFSEFLITKIHS